MPDGTCACERCGRPFGYAPGDHARNRRYCSDACRDEARYERNRIRRGQSGRRPERDFPLPPMPPPPDWDRAYCTTGPPRTRGYWTSDDPAQKQAAKYMCLTRCPEVLACELWSSCLPLNDPTVYAGMSPSERRKRRRAIREAIMRQALAGISR
jgi:hypothetical protein